MDRLKPHKKVKKLTFEKTMVLAKNFCLKVFCVNKTISMVLKNSIIVNQHNFLFQPEN